MKGYVEKIINEYPKMLKEKEHLGKQIESLEFVSAEEIINAMSFSHEDGERVQTSGTSDKTAKIAMGYQDKLERINDELLKPMQKKYIALDKEITFLESSIRCLPDNLSEVMIGLVLEGHTWEEVSNEMFVSVTKLQKLRKAAIEALVRVYQRREAQQVRVLLS